MTAETQLRLEEELERVQRILNVSFNLKVQWSPNEGAKLAGEVRDGVIYVYEIDREKALATLKHELVDYPVAVMLVNPLVTYINVLKRYIDTLIYERKENLLNGLTKFL